VDGRVPGVVRDTHISLGHGHVWLLARPGRAVRAAHGAVVRQHSQQGAGHRTPGPHVRQDLRSVSRSQVRRHVPNAHAAAVGVGPGAGEPRADRRLCSLHRSRGTHGWPGREPAGQRAVQNEGRQVEGDAAKAQSRVHGRQAEAHARPGGRLQRTADAQRGRGRAGHRRADRSARRARQVFHRRDRHVRVRSAAERHQRRALRVPPVRQGRVPAFVPHPDQGPHLDDLAGPSTCASYQRLPPGSRRVLHRRVHRYDAVPAGARLGQGRPHAVADPSQDRPGREQDRTVRYDHGLLTI